MSTDSFLSPAPSELNDVLDLAKPATSTSFDAEKPTQSPFIGRTKLRGLVENATKTVRSTPSSRAAEETQRKPRSLTDRMAARDARKEIAAEQRRARLDKLAKEPPPLKTSKQKADVHDKENPAHYWLATAELKTGTILNTIKDNTWESHELDQLVDGSRKELQSNIDYTRDSLGNVERFRDQYGIEWRRSKYDTPNEFPVWNSRDGGERRARVTISSTGTLLISDPDDNVTTAIQADGSTKRLVQTQKASNIETLLSIFAKVDHDSNDRLSWEELENALDNDAFSEQERQAIRTMKAHFSGIEWRARGTNDHMSDGISLDEFLQVDTSLSSRKDKERLTLFDAVFDASNFLGSINNWRYIEQSLRNMRRLPNDVTHAIECLISRLAELDHYRSCGLSTKARGVGLNRTSFRSAMFEILRNSDEQKSDWVTDEINDLNVSLFADNRNNEKARFSFRALSNGLQANHVFLSALASVIARDPEFVLRTIKPSDNAAYIVSFPGSSGLPIRVIQPSHREIHRFRQAHNFGIWPLVIANAYDDIELSHKQENDDRLPIEVMLSLLTARETQSLDTKQIAPTDLRAKLTEAWLSGKSIMLVRHPQKNSVDHHLRHTFAVVDWNSNRDCLKIVSPASLCVNESGAAENSIKE
ncbi:MAG: hypothetical protein K2Z81_22520, partial [Cyanobacteria bacterium]|nr:hypothetical protein [Cyanobacteriota bacterium]